MESRVHIVNKETHLQASLKDLTVYSSNLAELKSSKDSGSKVKYRVSSNFLHPVDYQWIWKILQPASVDLVATMTETSQKIDVQMSDIMVSIAPAAIRTMIGVTGSLGTIQVSEDNQLC